MVVAVALIEWLGFYIVTGLYMGFFARFIGRYRWYWVAASSRSRSRSLIYLVFERGFRVVSAEERPLRAGLPF